MDWIKIFASTDEMQNRLPNNKPQLLIVSGKRICLVKREGRLLAVQDSCNHSGESLSKGSVNYLGEIICPWHGYRFAMNTGKESAERCNDLVTYPIRAAADGVFIGL